MGKEGRGVGKEGGTDRGGGGGRRSAEETDILDILERWKS